MAYTTITDPSAYFQTTLYTGNETARTITNDGNSDLQPDFVWIKKRSNTGSHSLYDSTRGGDLALQSNVNTAEVDDNSQLTGFTSDGFTLGNESGAQTQPYPTTNSNSQTYVGWQWSAGNGTTSNNSDGSITSTVQANTTAGFSIITYTGTGSTATIGHGLNSAPEMIITKARSDGHSWLVGCTADSSDLSSVLVLQSTAASVTATGNYNAAPNSSTYQVVSAGGTNNNTDTYVAYVFHSVQGYSKIGSYTGNGNVDGPFVYTGFKPAWLLTKRTDYSDNWRLVDSTRYPFNDGSANCLLPNKTNNETDSGARNLDLLSNGFKVRTNDPDSNSSDGGSTYIYMAFAESPFVSSEGVPTTAR